MLSIRASNYPLHFGISEMHVSGGLQTGQIGNNSRLWISASSRLSGDANGTRIHKEGRMINLLYHATIYYEIRKFIQ